MNRARECATRAFGLGKLRRRCKLTPEFFNFQTHKVEVLWTRFGHRYDPFWTWARYNDRQFKRCVEAVSRAGALPDAVAASWAALKGGSR